MRAARKSAADSARRTDEAMSQEVLALLRVDKSNPSRLVSRENGHLEYKETFNWGSRAKYAKTMAAFSNAEGGFIVFGVKNSPRELKGVNVERFDTLDPEKVSAYLNSVLAPEIHWEAFRVVVSGVDLGVLAVLPNAGRPVVCTKNDGDDLRESDVYYRYRGRSERIRYPELQKLLTERVERERDAWFSHLSRVARIGVENVGVLDLVDGELSGPGGRLLISSDLLRKVQFIREGRFAERDDDGAPTLRVVGEVEAVAPGALGPVRTVAQPLVIGEKEIMLSFLRQERPAAPAEYIKQSCRESSRYQPVYHFARAAGLGLEVTRALVVREPGRANGLLVRIDGAKVAPIGSIDSGTPSSAERQGILAKLEAGEIEELRGVSRIRLFEAVTHFTPPVAPTELLALLAELVQKNFDKLSSLERSQCRKAVAHLDEVLNRAACAQRDVRGVAS